MKTTTPILKILGTVARLVGAAVLYPLVYQGGRPVIEGLRFSMMIGVLWVFPHQLAMAGAHGDSISYVFKNAAWHMVEQGVGGVIIGFVYGRVQAVAVN